jgi:glycosyltransferase involved in cell wall biosynthesis
VYGDDPQGENRGNFHHRIAAPVALLAGDERLDVRAMSALLPGFPRAALESDLVCLHMLAGPELAALVRARRARGLVTLFELHDVLEPGSWLGRDHWTRQPLARQALLGVAMSCDGLRVASRGQLDLFATLHPRVTLLDNMVPVPPRRPPRGAGFRVGFAGTDSHRDDLAAIAPVLIELAQRHPDVELAVMGGPALHALFAAAGRCELRPFAAYEDYLDFLRTLDVGVVPLIESPFNRGRSDTKIAELAASGAVAVVERHPAFAGHAEHAPVFRTGEQLRAILERLRAEPARREALAAAAFDWVMRHRSEAAMRAQRRAAYLEWLAGPPRDGDPAPGLDDERSAALRARLVRARAEHAAGDAAAALAICEELLARDPGYEAARYLALACLARLDRPAELLAQAPLLADSPLYGDQVAVLGHGAARAVATEQAQRWLERIQWPPARLRLQPSLVPDPVARFRRILEHEPFDYFALAGLERLLSRAGASAEVEPLRRRLELLLAGSEPATGAATR